MFDYLIRAYVINLKEFTVDSINYLGSELGVEFEISLTDGLELNFGMGHKGSSFCGTQAKKLKNLQPAASKNIILRLQHHQDS